MAILASIFALLGRFLGRVLTMALGWATILLFGRVPQSKQLLLSAVTLGSLAWVVALLGVVVPDIGSFLLTAVPVPDFIREEWVRLAMLGAALTIPILVGIGSLLLIEAADRPRRAGILTQILRGYPYALVLAVSLVFMAVVAPLRKLRSLARGWSDAHIPVVVKPGGYERVATDLEAALEQAGLAVDRQAAPRVLEVPSKLLAAVAGAGVRSLVPDRLIVLAAPTVEALIYPSDIHIAGRSAELARARAAIATRLTFTAAYLTSAEETQRLEDRLAKVAKAVSGEAKQAEAFAELAQVDQALATLEVPYEEWEVLYRLRLQVERDLLAFRARVEAQPRPVVAQQAPTLLDRAVAAVLASGFGLAAALLGRLLPAQEPSAEEQEPGEDGAGGSGRQPRREARPPSEA